MSMDVKSSGVTTAGLEAAGQARSEVLGEKKHAQEKAQGAVSDLVRSAMESAKPAGNVLGEANPNAPASASNSNKAPGGAETSGVSDAKTSKGNSSKMEKLLEIMQMLLDMLKSKGKGDDNADKSESAPNGSKPNSNGSDAASKGGGSPGGDKADGKQGAGKPEGNQGAGKADGSQAAAKPDDAQDTEGADEDKQILEILTMLIDLLKGKKSKKADHKKPDAGDGKNDKSLGDGKLTGGDFDKVMEKCLSNVMNGLKNGKVDPKDMEMLGKLGDMKEKLGLGNKSGGNSADNAGGESSQGQSAIEGGGKVANILQKLESTMKQIYSQQGNKISGGQEEEDEQAV